MSTGLPLIKSLLTQLAKGDLIPLGLSTGMSVADAAIQKKIYESGHSSGTTNKNFTCNNNFKWGMEDIMKIIKSLEESGLLIKGNTKTIRQLELKEINKKMDFPQCY